MTRSKFLSLISGRNVVFITVKNRDYIRVSQIEKILKENASEYRIYSSEKKNPVTRAIDLNMRMGAIDFSGCDVVILGFLPQLIYRSVSKKIKKLTKSGSISEVLADDAGVIGPVIVEDFFLSLYDTVILDRKLFGKGSFVAGLLRKIDKKTLEGAELLLTDTRADADFFAEEYGVLRDKFEVLYLEADKLYSKPWIWEDNYRFYNDAKELCESCLEETTADRSFNILYFGTGLPLQGTDVVMLAFNQVMEANNSAYANEKAGSAIGESKVVGAGRRKELWISCSYVGSVKKIPAGELKRAKENGIEIISWLSQEELAKKIAGADLCIAGHFNPEIDKANRTIPGKAIIYEAMGKTMILGDTVANHELFSEDERHIFVKRGDVAELAGAINTAYEFCIDSRR